MSEYKLLDNVECENIEKIREFAKARNERTLLEKRLAYINRLLGDNRDLKDSVWTTLEGETIPISDLDDSHLRNIVTHIRARGGHNSRIDKEYEKRFGKLPALPLKIYPDDDLGYFDDLDDDLDSDW
jgi:hypothetical protein